MFRVDRSRVDEEEMIYLLLVIVWVNIFFLRELLFNVKENRCKFI